MDSIKQLSIRNVMVVGSLPWLEISLQYNTGHLARLIKILHFLSKIQQCQETDEYHA